MSELSVGQLKGLPVNSNVVTVPSGHKLYAPGHVLQVVSITSSSVTTTASSAFQDTTITASITPSSVSSKIFIVIHATIGNSAGNNTYATVFRGTSSGTNLGNGSLGFGTSPALYAPFALNYLDSPNTTSTTQYMFAIRSTGANASVNSVGTAATITLMEIAA